MRSLRNDGRTDLRDAVFVEIPERLGQRLSVGDKQNGDMIADFLFGAFGGQERGTERRAARRKKQCAATRFLEICSERNCALFRLLLVMTFPRPSNQVSSNVEQCFHEMS
jgi:hypothetical protein